MAVQRLFLGIYRIGIWLSSVHRWGATKGNRKRKPYEPAACDRLFLWRNPKTLWWLHLNRVLPESRKDGIIMPIFKGAGVAIVTIVHMGPTVLSSAEQQVNLPHWLMKSMMHVSSLLLSIQQAEFLLLQVQDQTPQQRQFVCPHIHKVMVQMRCFL